MQNTINNTPEHCHKCNKFKDCNQAQNMNAYTEPQDAYMGDAEFLCKKHSNSGEFIGNIGESDSPEHCAICGMPLKCCLTSDGIEYVRESIKEGGGCCRELWPILFDYALN